MEGPPENTKSCESATQNEGREGDGKAKLHTCLAMPKSASFTSPLGPTSIFAPLISLPKKKLLKRFIQLFSAYGKSKQLYKLYITCGQCSSHANTQDPREFDQYNYESLVP